jgi:hypothetical protein
MGNGYSIDGFAYQATTKCCLECVNEGTKEKIDVEYLSIKEYTGHDKSDKYWCHVFCKCENNHLFYGNMTTGEYRRLEMDKEKSEINKLRKKVKDLEDKLKVFEEKQINEDCSPSAPIMVSAIHVMSANARTEAVDIIIDNDDDGKN